VKEIDLQGIIPAIVLPMDDHYAPDLPALRRYVEWLLPQEPVALAVNVDTGEGPHLSFGERAAVLETVANAAKGKCLIVAGIAGPYTDQAIANARQARQAGADALLVFPIPAFLGQPLNPEVPYQYHQAIAEASELPIILFQLQPALGGVIYEADTLLRLIEIEQVVAIKEASFDALRFLQTKNLLDHAPRRITLLTGNDNFILESFILGAEGALLGFSTLETALQVRMLQAVREGDYATSREIAARLQPFSDLIFRRPVTDYRARVKEVLRLQGIIPNNLVRPPLLPLSQHELNDIRSTVQSLGLVPT
jgi:4-hydroxy-tetrahydrodipicolinate synthase